MIFRFNRVYSIKELPMKAMILTGVTDLLINSRPLTEGDITVPTPAANQILIKVSRCGVCHTELDQIEGRTPPTSFPIIPGHQVVGTVEEAGADVTKHKKGDRVGVAWIFSSCGKCEFCLSGRDNLCAEFKATGRDADGRRVTGSTHRPVAVVAVVSPHLAILVGSFH